MYEWPYGDPAQAPARAPLHVGGALDFPTLLAAYRHGVFPWYSADEPVQWFSPNPRFVLLPDELMGDSSLLRQMIDVCESTSGGVVGLKQVPRDEVGAYGVIDPVGELDTDGVVRVRSLVEKPAVADAPSDLIVIGRYVLTPDVFDRIAEVRPGRGGEIQLTDALRVQAESGPFHGVLTRTRRYDTGNPLGWLTAVVELALDDPRIGTDFRSWLRTIV